MFPISDDRVEQGVPIVTWALIGVCAAVFLWQISMPPKEAEQAVFLYGMVPAVLFGKIAMPDAALPAWATIFTSMFMHGSIAHIGGNMLYLWIFGDNVELAMGRVRFLLFYILCGVAAALAQGFQAPESQVPMIGASGAISGVLGAYLLLRPFAQVRVFFMPIPFFVRILSIPAVVVLGFWFVLQFVSGLAAKGDQGGVAFWAHVGGFIAGMVLLPFFKARNVPLFEREPRRVFDARRESERGPWGRRRGPWDRS
jgi:membrane associated rhomboid family serine protease